MNAIKKPIATVQPSTDLPKLVPVSLNVDTALSTIPLIQIPQLNDDKLTTASTIDLCSPTIPLQSPNDIILQCEASPKSLVLERIRLKKPPELISPNSKKYAAILLSDSLVLTSPFKAPNVDIEFQTASLPECAKSPILSQPKTIRFPAVNRHSSQIGSKGARKSDSHSNGVCYWDNCSAKYDTSSLLLDHLQTEHVNSQSGPYSCLWAGCKVHSKESCSRRWVERHVLEHCGKNPYKCIVGSCGRRFGTKETLEKHVNSHFNANVGNNSNKRSSDPPAPKLIRKNGKTLRYRRQPWSGEYFSLQFYKI